MSPDQMTSQKGRLIRTADADDPMETIIGRLLLLLLMMMMMVAVVVVAFCCCRRCRCCCFVISSVYFFGQNYGKKMCSTLCTMHYDVIKANIAEKTAAL